MSALLGHEMQGVWLNIILGVYIPLKSPFKSIDWAKQSTAFSLGKLHRIKDLHPSMGSLKETLISYSWAGARSGLRQLKVKHKISSCCWLNCDTNWTPNLTSRAPLHQLKRFPFLVEKPAPLQLLMAFSSSVKLSVLSEFQPWIFWDSEKQGPCKTRWIVLSTSFATGPTTLKSSQD